MPLSLAQLLDIAARAATLGKRMDAAPVTEPRAFYRRGGALLCVLHLLDATDFHGENLIASGDFAVPIDAEALFSPRARVENAASGAAAARRLDESVLRTGMLPHFEVGPDVRGSYDISGLGGGADGPRGATRRFSRWEHCGSDAQSRAESWEAVPLLPAAPFGNDGAELEPAEWAGEIEAGFAQTHAWLRQERAALNRADGPISSLEKHPVRWIFRATGVYGALLEQARRPHWLRDGWEHSVKLELLSRFFLPPTARFRPRSGRCNAPKLRLWSSSISRCFALTRRAPMCRLETRV